MRLIERPAWTEDAGAPLVALAPSGGGPGAARTWGHHESPAPLDEWLAEPGPAVCLPNSAEVDLLRPHLGRLELVVLEFPKWTDGRAYSQARLIRRRLRYAGELRAIGEVLVDMLPLLQRTGFDSAQLRADQDPEQARRALGFFSAYYQGDVHEPRPWFARGQALA